MESAHNLKVTESPFPGNMGGAGDYIDFTVSHYLTDCRSMPQTKDIKINLSYARKDIL